MRLLMAATITAGGGIASRTAEAVKPDAHLHRESLVVAVGMFESKTRRSEGWKK